MLPSVVYVIFAAVFGYNNAAMTVSSLKILIANLGSTSFKYSLFDMDGEKVLASGRVERIGDKISPCRIEVGGVTAETDAVVPDHAAALRQCLDQLARHGLKVAAVGFKAVHAAGISGVQRVDNKILDAMEEINDIMPAHNPPYVKAMRLLHSTMPDIPLVAAFETGFHQTIPARQRYYGVPFDWAEKYNVQRYGFHGASHRYIATRIAELEPALRNGRIISMHLGGSSSLCAVKDGKSVAASMGSSAQTGLFQNNRVGDFDPFMLPYLMRKLDKTLPEMLQILSNQSGFLGLSGVSNDMRDVRAAAENGNERAKIALEVFIGNIRNYMGAYLVELGGADVVVFTGGIGENNVPLRRDVCRNLSTFGIILDEEKNAAAKDEVPIHSKKSKTQIWVVPTNEELIVARQVKEVVSGS